MTARARQLGKQAMDALENAVLNALADAENGECFNARNCEGGDEHGQACISKVAGIYSGGSMNHAIVEGTFQYLKDKGLLEKPRGYKLTALGRKSLDGEI